MNMRQFVLGAAICCELGMAGLVSAQTNFLDWKFSDASNPASPTTASPASTATASIAGASFNYFTSAAVAGGGSGIYGNQQTGLWNFANFGAGNPSSMTLSVPSLVGTTANIRVDVYQFVDSGAFFPGAISFNLPNAISDGRTVYEQQSGNMQGMWVKDSFHWNSATFGSQATLVISPTASNGGLLIDEVVFSASVVPEPTSAQLLASGLFLGCGLVWYRRKKAVRG